MAISGVACGGQCEGRCTNARALERQPEATAECRGSVAKTHCCCQYRVVVRGLVVDIFLTAYAVLHPCMYTQFKKS